MSDSESESERPRALFIDFGSPNHHDQPDQANSDIETGLPTRTAHEGINALWHNEVEHLVNGNKVYNDYKGINLSLHTFEDILAAAPRRQRQKNTVEYIKDRTKRIKQNNNETNRILNRLYELSLQTKLPAVLGFGNLDTIGSSALSQPKLWMSPTLMEASTSDCQQIVEHWDNIMKSIAQNGDILRSQDDYKLKEKVKQLLSSDSMTQEILKQAEDIGLGFLMQRIYEYNQGDDDTEMLDILEDLDDDNQMEIETDTED
eukprot:643113_1